MRCRRAQVWFVHRSGLIQFLFGKKEGAVRKVSREHIHLRIAPWKILLLNFWPRTRDAGGEAVPRALAV
jgi:hypothetical protein